MSDDCKDITIKKLKEILKEKKKSNNNIKLSGKRPIYANNIFNTKHLNQTRINRMHITNQ